MADDKLIVGLSADIKDLKNELNKAQGVLKGFSDKANTTANDSSKSFNAIGGAANKLGGILAGAFAAGSIISFGKSVIDTTAQFQKFEAVLSNTLGSSSAAQMAMQQIVDFASTTPFAVDELTNSFVKLANQGFKPTVDEMRSLGDLAASTGKSFDQLAEGILDAQTGQFERLKEFGIIASAQGDKVKFTFKGVTTEVEKTSDAMRGYILSLGKLEGVTGAMSKIAATLGGQLSNLGDNWTTLMKTIGDSNEGVLSKTTGLLNDILSAWNKIGSADNITLKLGIDQRGINFADNVPFAELQNLWGGITGGQSANMLLAETYENLGKQIADAKTIKELENLKKVFQNTRNELEKGSPQWVIYNQRLIDASDAVMALVQEKKKAIANTKEETNSINALEAKLKTLKEQYNAATIGSAAFNKLGKEIKIVTEQLEKLKQPKISAKDVKFKMPSLEEQALRADVDISALQEANKEISDFQAQTNMLNGNLKDLAIIGGASFTSIQIPLDQLTEKVNLLKNVSSELVLTIGAGLSDAMVQAYNGTAKFGDAFFAMLKQLTIKLLAAVAAAAALAAIISIATGGTNLVGGVKLGFKDILGRLTGGLLGAGGTSNRVVSPVGAGAMGQGSVEFNIMGDKLHGVLKNYTSRLDRLQ